MGAASCKYVPRLLRVDVSTPSVQLDVLPSSYRRLGGRALSSRIVIDEVPPACDPLGPENKLVLACGCLAGTVAPSAGRLSVGGKSPLTGGIKESNVGGTAGSALSRLAIRAIVLEGQAAASQLLLLHVTSGQARLLPADDLRSLTTYETVQRLRGRFGKSAAIICVGPAGERLAQLATLAVTERDGWPSRHAARGGLGALAGSKGIKAIVLERGEGRPEATHADEFRQAALAFARDIAVSRSALMRFGTSHLMDIAQALGGLPTRNFREGRFDGAEAIGPEALRRTIESRGGRTGVACHPGCPIRCSNVYNDVSGGFLTASLEYETIALMGANLGVGDLDDIARMDRTCDELGVDTIDTAISLAILMESGVLQFGDGAGAREMIERAVSGERSGLGPPELHAFLSEGPEPMGKRLGCRRIATVKGQGIGAYDPRVFKATGMTYASSPMGADHTAGNVLPGRSGYHRVSVDPGHAEPWILSHDLQVMTAVCDILGLCFFVGATSQNVEVMAQLVSALEGEYVTALDLLNLAKRTITMERRFNLAAGLRPETDSLPRFFLEEPLPPNGQVFDQGADVAKLVQFMSEPEVAGQQGTAADPESNV